MTSGFQPSRRMNKVLTVFFGRDFWMEFEVVCSTTYSKKAELWDVSCVCWIYVMKTTKEDAEDETLEDLRVKVEISDQFCLDISVGKKSADLGGSPGALSRHVVEFLCLEISQIFLYTVSNQMRNSPIYLGFSETKPQMVPRDLN